MTANVTCKVCNLCLQLRVTWVTHRRVLPAAPFSGLAGWGFGSIPLRHPQIQGLSMARVGLWGLGRSECPHCTHSEPKLPHCTHSDLCACTAQGTAGTKCLHHPYHQLWGPVSLQGLLGERFPAFLGQISLPLALGSCSPWLTDRSSLPRRWQHRRCTQQPLSQPGLATIPSLTRKMTLLVVLPPTNPTCAGREL